jgi:hypothetical protein
VIVLVCSVYGVGGCDCCGLVVVMVCCCVCIAGSVLWVGVVFDVVIDVW